MDNRFSIYAAPLQGFTEAPFRHFHAAIYGCQGQADAYFSPFLRIDHGEVRPRDIREGDNVWIGGNTVICPGVHIGSNTVIGAGSVVTKDIPDWCVAAGNPCRVLREITDDDMRKLFRDEEIDEEAWEEIAKGMNPIFERDQEI